MQPNRSLSFHASVIFVLLLLQYILGMVTNLFVQFPQDQKDGQLWEFAWRQLPLASHIVLGLLLLLGSIVLVIRSIMQKNTMWIIASCIGALSILIAGMSGAVFIPTQRAIYSFVMSLTFITACLSYGMGIYLSKKKHE